MRSADILIQYRSCGPGLPVLSSRSIYTPLLVATLHQQQRGMGSAATNAAMASDGGVGGGETCEVRYLIVRAEKCGLLELIRFLASDEYRGHEFLEGPAGEGEEPIFIYHHRCRWVIVVSIIVCRIIALFGKPMEWTGMALEFLLNLLSLNGGIAGLLHNALAGKVVVPLRGSDTFISAIGHLDSRVDLYKADCPFSFAERNKKSRDPPQNGEMALIDLCMMASKLAYENANIVKNIVTHHWKMHFVEFYNCWNDFQKDSSTQVFILCDKPKDASLVLISFRGTEPFDPDDWITDFDYSWYEIPKVGKVHMGFLEALGLGNRDQASSFQVHLQDGGSSQKTMSANTHPSGTGHSSIKEKDKLVMTEKMTAYYTVRSKLKRLLHKHKKAKFIVTGHSLGGALAILFSVVLLLHNEEEIMKRLLGVYTFGQPRVGDRQLQRYMEAHICHPVPKYFRLVYCNDLVPRLPYDNKAFLYKHFGLCLYYNSFYIEQDMDEEPNRNFFGMRYLLPEYLNAVWELIRSFIMGYIYGPEYKESWFSILLRVLGLAMPGISAHSPTNYINCIRLGTKIVQMRTT